MKTLKWFLDKELAEPLTIDRLKTYVFKDGLQFVYYSKLKSIPANGGLVILWDGESGVGHYTLLWRGGGHLHYFDPLGLHPTQLGKIVHIDSTKLLKLLPEDTRFNHTQYQKIRKNVQTCGRLCVIRYNFKDFSDKQFRGLMYLKGVDPDTLVTLFTLDSDLSHWKHLA